MNPLTTLRALREYRRNFTTRGVLIIVRQNWRALIFRPADELAKASRLTDGAFS